MKRYLLLTVLAVACDPATSPDDEGGSVYALEPDAANAFVPDAAVTADRDAGSVSVAPCVEPPPAEIDYGGQVGWYCCRSSICQVVQRTTCKPGETVGSDGLHTCCVVDVGQCDLVCDP